MNEYTLSVDKFKKPKVFKNEEAVYILLIRLLLLVPGTIESHPEMGIGLIEKWRYLEIDRISELKSEITKQIGKYLPQLQYVDVTLIPNEIEKELYIKISINNTLYVFKTDSTKQTITLSEL